MKNTVIIDTGFLVALANKNDSVHQVATQASLIFKHWQWITTWCVITESCYLLQQRLGENAPQRLINKISQGILNTFDLKPDHCPRIEVLMDQYQNLPMDLADASLVILAEHLGHGRILSTDQRDFNTYRWKNTHPFEDLLLP